MPETEKATPSAPYAELKERLGEEKFRQRLTIQANHWARLSHQGEGIFKLEKYISIDNLAKWCLTLLLLWPRAHDNIFKIRTVEQHWHLPNLPPAFEGFRLLQLTDLHTDIEPKLAPLIAEKVAGCPHDALVITGDYRNSTVKDSTPSMRLMPKILAASDKPRFGILGNHDLIEKVDRLEEAGLPILLNESASIERDGEKLWIAGVDDPHFYKTQDFAKAAAGIPQDACTVVLCHSPEVHAEAANHNFQLMLSGHTHGGQICLPGGRHIVCPVKNLTREYISGRWKNGSLQGYTSPGTGCCGVAARLNCPPEITVHILHKSDDATRGMSV